MKLIQCQKLGYGNCELTYNYVLLIRGVGVLGLYTEVDHPDYETVIMEGI